MFLILLFALPPQELNKEIYEGEGDESRKSSHIARMSLMKTPKKWGKMPAASFHMRKMQEHITIWHTKTITLLIYALF